MIAKTGGFVTGLVGAGVAATTWPGLSAAFLVGVIAWYTTLGAIIGLCGPLDRHPLFPAWRLRWWLRGAVMGAWMNLLLLLLMHEQLAALAQAAASPGSVFGNPSWILAEGALIGLVLDGLATRLAGEGRQLMVGRP